MSGELARQIAVCNESVLNATFPGLFRETIPTVTCLKQQAKKIGGEQAYEVYE